MKTTATLLLALTMIFSTSGLFAQNDLVVNYRVTAIKAGDNEIESVSNQAEVRPGLTVFVPNAFTPNEDGLNDAFGAIGYGVESYTMRIFNRWGELIFESYDMGNQWTGTYNGKKVMPGSYTYNIEAKGFKNETFNKEGIVSIVKI